MAFCTPQNTVCGVRGFFWKFSVKKNTGRPQLISYMSTYTHQGLKCWARVSETYKTKNDTFIVKNIFLNVFFYRFFRMNSTL